MKVSLFQRTLAFLGTSRLWSGKGQRTFRRIRDFCRCWTATPGRRSLPAPLKLGRTGEKLAAAYLRRNGFRILYKNFRSRRGGEIDLICRDRAEKTLVFVEVKTRSTDAFGDPHLGVTRAQQQRIVRGAKEWLRLLNDPRVTYRFDVVEVLMKPAPRINLIRGAFQMPDDIYF
ncbi:MAG TPA: YraN family protein [Chthoniobacterales bacterium]|nr:YraN family protein [Chthoniobacterales bacterium]